MEQKKLDIDDRYIFEGVKQETDPKKLAELEEKAHELEAKLKRLMEEKKHP